MDSIFIFLDRIYRIDGIFFACGERPFGRRPSYPDDPVDPVQLLFKDKNPFLFLAVLRYLFFLDFTNQGFFLSDRPLFWPAAGLTPETFIIF